MVAHTCNPSYSAGLRQENCLNPGGGGCGELRSHHCPPVWVTRAKLRLKKKKKRMYNTNMHSLMNNICTRVPTPHAIQQDITDTLEATWRSLPVGVPLFSLFQM